MYAPMQNLPKSSATKATTTEAGHANWPAEAGADDPYATKAASANRTPSEAADRSASEAAATDAAAKAGSDRSTPETTTTYRPSPKAAADCTAAETATHTTTTEPAAQPGTHRHAILLHRAGQKPRREGKRSRSALPHRKDKAYSWTPP